MDSVSDGLKFSIMILEVDPDQAVVWTKPDELEFDPRQPRKYLGRARDKGFIAAFGEGTVQIIEKAKTEQSVRSRLTARGKDILF